MLRQSPLKLGTTNLDDPNPTTAGKLRRKNIKVAESAAYSSRADPMQACDELKTGQLHACRNGLAPPRVERKPICHLGHFAADAMEHGVVAAVF